MTEHKKQRIKDYENCNGALALLFVPLMVGLFIFCFIAIFTVQEKVLIPGFIILMVISCGGLYWIYKEHKSVYGDSDD